MLADRRIFAAVFVFTFTFANWVHPYREFALGKSTNNTIDSSIQGTDDVSYRAAGFPWTFYQRFDCENSPTWFAWDSLPFIGNVVFWAIIFLFACWYSGTFRGESQEPKPGIRWRWSLTDLLMVTTLVASVFSYVVRNQSRYSESQRLIQWIRNDGGAAMEASYLPSWLPNDPLFRLILPLDRIVEVSIDNPTSSLLSKIIALPNLQSLGLSGSSYSLSDLQPLLGNPHLTYLRLSGRELDVRTTELIGQLKSLQSLNLTNTNITDAGMVTLGEMPRLRYVHLGHTNIELQDPKLESWMKSVRYLRLPRPTRSDLRRFHLDGWPELLEVQCMDVDDLIDGNPVSLSISNAPKLSTLSLVEHQAFDLNLDDLPSFTDLLIRRKGFWRNQNTVQGNLWIQNLSFKNLGALRKATFNVGGFESIRIQGCPALECEVHSIRALSEEDTQAFIEGVSKSIGIKRCGIT